MKTLLTAVVATISLSALSCHAFESNQAVAGSDMEHYVFTYNSYKPVNSVNTQFKETRQTLNYVLALDIQDQVYSNLNTIVDSNSSILAKRRVQRNSQFRASE